MNLFVLFGDGAITWKKKEDGNFASCAMRNDAVSRHFFGAILHLQTCLWNTALSNKSETLQDEGLDKEEVGGWGSGRIYLGTGPYPDTGILVDGSLFPWGKASLQKKKKIINK
jgi:hypothetical protein